MRARRTFRAGSPHAAGPAAVRAAFSAPSVPARAGPRRCGGRDAGGRLVRCGARALLRLCGAPWLGLAGSYGRWLVRLFGAPVPSSCGRPDDARPACGVRGRPRRGARPCGRRLPRGLAHGRPGAPARPCALAVCRPCGRLGRECSPGRTSGDPCDPPPVGSGPPPVRGVRAPVPPAPRVPGGPPLFTPVRTVPGGLCGRPHARPLRVVRRLQQNVAPSESIQRLPSASRVCRPLSQAADVGCASLPPVIRAQVRAPARRRAALPHRGATRATPRSRRPHADLLVVRPPRQVRACRTGSAATGMFATT